MTNSTNINRNQNLSAINNDIKETVFFGTEDNTFDEIEMNLAADGIDFILDLLTDLSVNRGAYAIREAFSNAYDATVVTGDMSLPIEIELPKTVDGDNIVTKLNDSTFADYAIIRDHGCGMSEEDVRCYFTQYGGSKKRGTDNIDTVGSKGLGSKAPLAVADTFTVKTTKDGITTTAILERRDGRNYASIASKQTGETNGTEIKIPVCDAQVATQMRECAVQIAKNSIHAHVLVDGVELSDIDGNDSVADFTINGNKQKMVSIGEIKIATDDDGNDVKFRMWQSAKSFPFSASSANILFNLAGVNYDLAKAGWYRNQHTIIIEGEPGYLNFTPSRDEIKMDNVKDRFLGAVKQALENHDFSDAAADFLAASDMKSRLEWVCCCNRVSVNDVTVSISNHGYDFSVPASLFIDENGTDYSTIIDDSDVDATKACIVHRTVNTKGLSVAYWNDIRFYTDGVKKSELAELIADAIESDSERAYVDGAIYKMAHDSFSNAYYSNRNGATKAAVIVTGTDTDSKNIEKFVKGEAKYANLIGTGSIDYFFVADADITDKERMVLDLAYDKVKVVEIESANETIKDEYAKARAASKNTQKNTVPVSVVKAEAEQKIKRLTVNRYDIRPYSMLDARKSYGKGWHSGLVTVLETIDCTDPNVIEGAVFALGNKLNDSAIHAMCDFMNTIGIIDAKRLYIVENMTAAEGNALVAQGAVIFADTRKSIKNHLDNIVDKCDLARVSYMRSDVPECLIDIDKAFEYADKMDAELWHDIEVKIASDESYVSDVEGWVSIPCDGIHFMGTNTDLIEMVDDENMKEMLGFFADSRFESIDDLSFTFGIVHGKSNAPYAELCRKAKDAERVFEIIMNPADVTRFGCRFNKELAQLLTPGFAAKINEVAEEIAAKDEKVSENKKAA